MQRSVFNKATFAHLVFLYQKRKTNPLDAILLQQSIINYGHKY